MSKIKYAFDEIAENWNDRDWIHQRLETRVAGPVVSRIHGSSGVDMMSEDWDNLLILDAARADMFEETIDHGFDDYTTKTSPGCSSPEWMRNTFDGREFPDTVYVSANPWVSKIAPDSFHHVHNLWVEMANTTDEELQESATLQDTGVTADTIHAEDLTEAAIRMNKEYPNKRLIVHYFQPHAPCIGLPDGSTKPESEVDKDMHPGRTLKNGDVSKREVWMQYQDNLEYVFKHALDLDQEIGGKSVFTADHGEMFGEWCWPVPIRGYAHPSGLRHPKLTTVPWATLDGDRRRVTAGDVDSHKSDKENINERLRNLGYKT